MGSFSKTGCNPRQCQPIVALATQRDSLLHCICRHAHHMQHSTCMRNHRCVPVTDKLRGHADEQYLPPKLETLLVWSTLFRCEGTWSNYAGYVKTACLLVGADTKVSCIHSVICSSETANTFAGLPAPGTGQGQNSNSQETELQEKATEMDPTVQQSVESQGMLAASLGCAGGCWNA